MLRGRSRIGLQVGASTRSADLGRIAAEAEQLGFGELWLAEDYFEHGGVSSTAVALSATASIPVGLGVVAAVARHPAVLAMEFATLAGAFPGRFMAGVGHGSPPWVRQMGLTPSSPLAALREVTVAVGELLGGAELTRRGLFDFDRVRLEHPAPAPLYLGVHGPRSLRLAGEVADGTLLGWFSSAGYVRWARDRITEGARAGGRDDSHQVVCLCILSIADDADRARAEIEAWAAPLLAAMASSIQMTVSAEGSELAARVERDDAPEGTGRLPEDLLGRFLAAGTEVDCGDTIAGLFEAGADRVVLVPNPGGIRSTEAMVEQMRRAAPLVRMAMH